MSRVPIITGARYALAKLLADLSQPRQEVATAAAGAALAVLELRGVRLDLGMPRCQRLGRTDVLIMAALVGAALLLRVPALETIPLGADPDEGSFGEIMLSATTGQMPDPFAVGW